MNTTRMPSTLVSTLTLTVLLALGACAEDPSSDVSAFQEQPPDLNEDETTSEVKEAPAFGQQDARNMPALPNSVNNRYIVRLRDDVRDPVGKADELARKHGASRRHVFGHAIKGFTLLNLPEAELEALTRDPSVLSVREDVQVPLAYVNQSRPGWALDRIDQSSGFNGSFESYFHGGGTHIYIVDSGIQGNHVEFKGRLGAGVNTCDGTQPTYDELGHGTSVASAAGGSSLGVARESTLHPVKITDNGSAWASDAVAGVDWVVANAKYPAVLNFSLGGDNDSIADALAGAIRANITVVKAAGNDHEDACTDESNTVLGVIVVGATDSADKRTSFSDYGVCLSLFAPGMDVLVADNSGASMYTTDDGTSFAAPYVAGVAAAMLAQDPTLEPEVVEAYIRSSAWAGVVQDWNANSPNLLLNSHHQVASITGRSDIISGYVGEDPAVTYTWTAKTLGGSGVWTFKWERSINGGAFSQIGTSKSVSLTVQPGSKYSMILRLTATSLGRAVVRTHGVKVIVDDICTNPRLCPDEF